MKTLSILCLLLSLTGCQLQSFSSQPPATSDSGLAVTVEPESDTKSDTALQLADDEAALIAWLMFKERVLNSSQLQREQWQLQDTKQVADIQSSVLQLHPENNYLTRFRAQLQLAERLMVAPPELATLFRWELAFNQKLLETESAVSALTRINSELQQELEQKAARNRELEQQIEALTQIEARLNQPEHEELNE